MSAACFEQKQKERLMMKEFWLCFVPLFVAVDVIGVLPFFLSLTDGVPADRMKKIVAQSVVTASAVALVFLLFGPVLLRFMGITVSDFMIAGGLLLLVLSLNDLLAGGKNASHDRHGKSRRRADRGSADHRPGCPDDVSAAGRDRRHADPPGARRDAEDAGVTGVERLCG